MKYGDVMKLTETEREKWRIMPSFRVMFIQPVFRPSPDMEELFVGVVLDGVGMDETGEIHNGWLTDAFEVVP